MKKFPFLSKRTEGRPKHWLQAVKSVSRLYKISWYPFHIRILRFDFMGFGIRVELFAIFGNFGTIKLSQ